MSAPTDRLAGIGVPLQASESIDRTDTLVRHTVTIGVRLPTGHELTLYAKSTNATGAIEEFTEETLVDELLALTSNATRSTEVMPGVIVQHHPDDAGPEDDTLAPLFRKWDDARLCALIADELAKGAPNGGMVLAIASGILFKRVRDACAKDGGL